MNNKKNDVPLSRSHVSLKLTEIQRRCSELLNEPDALAELTLEDAAGPPLFGVDDVHNPYRRG